MLHGSWRRGRSGFLWQGLDLERRDPVSHSRYGKQSGCPAQRTRTNRERDREDRNEGKLWRNGLDKHHVACRSFDWRIYRVRAIAYTEVALSTLLMHMFSPALWHGDFRCSSWPLDIKPGSPWSPLSKLRAGPASAFSLSSDRSSTACLLDRRRPCPPALTLRWSVW